jgi:hypothetical protein
MTNISKKTLNKIKKEKINPIPKWQFSLKNWVILSAAFVSALIGALAMAVVFHVAFNRDWFIYRSVPHRPPLGHLLLDLPFIWLGLVMITIVIAVYYFEHSKKGYHWSPFWIILASIIFSVGIGFALSFLGLGKRVDSFLGGKVARYRDVEKRGREVWSAPEEGHLGGEIIKIEGEIWAVRDLTGKIWQVDISDLSFVDLKPSIGSKVKIIGEKTQENLFEAKEIHNWREVLDKFFRRPPGPPPNNR